MTGKTSTTSSSAHPTRNAAAANEPPQTPARRVLGNKSNTFNKGMPPKKTSGSGSAGGSGGGASAKGKQLSLLGFFSKANGPAPASAAVGSKATPAAASAASSSSKKTFAAPFAKGSKAAVIAAATEALQTPPPTTDRAKGASSSSSTSNALLNRGASEERASSPPLSSPTTRRQATTAPAASAKPLPAFASASASAAKPKAVQVPMDLDDDDDDDDDAVVSFTRKRASAKRSINYAESEDEGNADSGGEGFKPAPKAKSSASARPAKRARGSRSRADEDDFIVPDDESVSDHASVIAISDDDDDADGQDGAEEDDEEEAPRKVARKKPTSSARASQAKSSSPASSSVNAFSAMSSSAASRPGMQKSTSLSHLTKAERRVVEEKRKKAANEEAYSFLVDLRDKDGNRPGDENYDSRTVYIPKNAWKDFTPFETQFWTIKQNHWDTVLFFQKGKFYELYEEDALIGHREFDLKLTDRVKMKMVGVPEHSFDIFAAKFLALGYKVGRVDQMETAVAKDMRTGQKSRGGGGEIVRRELRHVLTSGTIVDTSALPDDMSSYCIAIKETVESDSPLAEPSFGICTLDAATAEFSLTSFKDDASRTKFETLLRSLRLREILYEKGQLSKSTLRLMKGTIPSSCQITQLRPGSEFLGRAATLEKLKDMFGGDANTTDQDKDEADKDEADKDEADKDEADKDEADKDEADKDEADKDEADKDEADKDEADKDEADKDADVEEAEPESEQIDPRILPEAIRSMLDEDNAISALGGMLWYLTQLNLDKDLCASRNFNIFDPLRKRQCLVLDAQSLSHLNVLQNDRGDDEGTLHKLLNRCITPFGKRLFKIWLVSPLADAKAINARLDAVDDFMRDTAFEDAFGAFARKLPDIERIMPRIHAGKAKPRDFTNVLNAFGRFSRAIENLSEIAQDFQTSTIRSLLEKVPDVTARAEKLKATFDVEESGAFVPRRGEHEAYDDADDNLDRIEAELKQSLEQHAKFLKLKVGKTIKFKDVGTKEIYQVEVPKKTVVPKSWASVSSTKNEARYYPEDVRDLVQELKEGREIRLAALKDFMQVTYAAFSEDAREYTAAIKTIAEIDCLLSLAKASYAMGEPTCRPEFIESDAAEIAFEELRHPCIAHTTSADFIPNDIALGGEADEIIVLTGGNMAGKSTTARTAATAVIIAQMGCRVPAASARLAPVDRIASRMGANDQLFKNNSTFMVEMLEASRIIAECTPRSLVIMDELGRGTSTFDGQAIAYSVLHHLAGRTRCLGFFLTHYTTLAHDFESYPRVSNKHMQVLVDDKAREIVFTYRLVPGIAESSFGTQVAALAGVPHEICDRAADVSKEFMESIKRQQASRSVSGIPMSALSDVAYLFKLAEREDVPDDDEAMLLSRQLSIMKAQIATQGTETVSSSAAAPLGSILEDVADGDGDVVMASEGGAAQQEAGDATSTGVPARRTGSASYAGRNKRRWQSTAEDGDADPHRSRPRLDSVTRIATGTTSIPDPKRTGGPSQVGPPAKKQVMEQMILDLGQRTTIECRQCGMSYDRSSTDDRALHQRHHDRIVEGLEWPTSSAALRTGRLIDPLVSASHANSRQLAGVEFWLYNLEELGVSSCKPMRELLQIVDEALGATSLPEDTLRRCKVFVSKRGGRAVGVAVVGRVRPGSARRVLRRSDTTGAPHDDEGRADVGGESVVVSGNLPADECPPMGLHRIYVVPALRRSGIAAALLDAILGFGVYGQSAQALEKTCGGRAGVLAFSQPTQSGKKLAETWIGRGSDAQAARAGLIIFEE